MALKNRWIFRLLLAVVLLLSSILACYVPFNTPDHSVDIEMTLLVRLEGTETAESAMLTKQAANKANNQVQQSPQPVQQSPQPIQQSPLPVQNPPSTETDRNYTGRISAKTYLDSSDNTWKCDDSTLYAYSFTLHFYPDGSIMMDNTQLNYTAVATTFHFQPNSSSPGRFDGSDPTSSDYILVFPNSGNGDFSTLEFVETLNDPNGNPGSCAYQFTQAASNP
ncbi:MAG: hypothetical protein ABSA01_15485 [Anaerolineales bacterium]|jgi:hypothetical protein